MSRPALGAAALAALLATALPASADEPIGTVVAPSQDRMTWSSDHPFALGSRAGVWAQGYAEPGIGGQLRFQPWSFIGLEGFADNFARLSHGTLKRDHVNGFNLFFPLTRNRSWSVSPQFGVCDDFEFVSPFGGGSGPSVQDVLMGAHAGLQAEARFGGGLSVEAEVDAFGYLGHGAALDRWTASLNDSLSGRVVAVSTVALNYYF
jgi:hypothetical protein